MPVPSRDVKCPFFDFRQLSLDGEIELSASEGFTVLFAAEGEFSANGAEVPRRTSALATPGAPIVLRGRATVFATRYR